MLARLIGVMVSAVLSISTISASANQNLCSDESLSDAKRLSACADVLRSTKDYGATQVAHSSRAEIFHRQGKNELVIKELDALIRRMGDNGGGVVEYYRFRSDARIALGQFDQAIAELNAAIARKVKFADEALAIRAEVYRAKGDFERALSDLNQAVANSGQNAQLIFLRAKFFYETKQYDRSIADYSKVLEIVPEHARGGPFNNRALIWRDIGDYDKAIADFTSAINVVGDFADRTDFVKSLSNRGETWRLKGDLIRALQDQSDAILVDSKERFGLPRVLRGDTHRYAGDFNQALSDYDEAVRIEPILALPAHVGKGLTFERLRDEISAKQEFEKALGLGRGRSLKDIQKSAFLTAQSRVAAINSGAAQPTVAAEPAKILSQKSVPTPAVPLNSEQTAKPINEKRVALIIGNSGYEAVGSLQNPRKDAQTIAALFRSVGFQKVEVVEDVTRDRLISILRNFEKEAEHAEWAVVYYAGHGIEVSGVNYLIPTDAKLAVDRDVQIEAVPIDHVMAAVEGARKLKIVILDACRDNPFAPKMRKTETPELVVQRITAGGSVTTRSIGRGLGEVKVSGATLVVYAAKHGQIALDGEGGNSPFAVALVQRVSTPGVEINKIFRLIRDDVMEATAGRQEPFTYGSLPGREDFFFVPK